MFYLKTSEAQELFETIYLENEHSQTLPYFADISPQSLAGCSLRMAHGLEIVDLKLEDVCLLWNPQTAMWCHIEPAEQIVCGSLKRYTTLSALCREFPQYGPRNLTAFLKHLYRRGMLTINKKPGIDPDIYKDGPLFASGYLVELFLTEKCNLACRYCFANAAPENSVMPLHIGRLAIDKAFALPCEKFIIEFAGGETFLEFNSFNILVDYIEKKKKQTNKEPDIVVQSNGTMFNKPKILDYLLRKKIGIGVSCDGPPEVHNAVRPLAGGRGSAGAVWRGIEALKKAGHPVPTITTVSRSNVNQPERIVEYFVSSGIHLGMFKEILRLGRARDSWSKLAIRPEEFFEFMKRFLEYVADVRPLFQDLTTKRLFSNLVTRTRDFRCMRSPCHAGVDYFAIRPNGDVYPCAEYVRPDLKMGNVKDPDPLDTYYERHPLLIEMTSRTVNKIPRCRECLWRHLCEAECSLAALKNTGTFYQAPPLCNFYKRIYPFLLEYAYKNPQVVCEYIEGVEAVDFSLEEGEAEM